MKLWTTKDVAESLGCSERKVKSLPITIVRVGRSRRYDPKDVERYIVSCKEVPASARRPEGVRRDHSNGIGLDEALRLYPCRQVRVTG
jgi:hypothetical protein